MNQAQVLYFILGSFSFVTGLGVGMSIRNALTTRVNHRQSEDLKDARTEILRLRAQVANIIGRQ
jgi:hypothetical protein